jgi:hypothetical protein
VAPRYISSSEWLARLILKQAVAGGAGALPRSTIGEWVVAREDDLSASIAHAVKMGWLVEEGGELRLTPSGEEIGKRPRAAGGKRRTRRRRYLAALGTHGAP